MLLYMRRRLPSGQDVYDPLPYRLVHFDSNGTEPPASAVYVEPLPAVALRHDSEGNVAADSPVTDLEVLSEHMMEPIGSPRLVLHRFDGGGDDTDPGGKVILVLVRRQVGPERFLLDKRRWHFVQFDGSPDMYIEPDSESVVDDAGHIVRPPVQNVEILKGDFEVVRFD